MELNGFWQVSLGGMLGPLLLELVKIAGLQTARDDLSRYRDPMYWVATGALFLIAGTVVALHGTSRVPVLHAVEWGIGAPAIIAGYATASTSRKPPGASFIGGREREAPGFLGKMQELLAW